MAGKWLSPYFTEGPRRTRLTIKYLKLEGQGLKGGMKHDGQERAALADS